MSANVDALVENSYHALLTVVQTTAVSRRVLQRPPFTFLHKLLVETLERYGIFSPQQLVFSELISKEDKAAFLTRSLAFVSYAMANMKEKGISVLLLVSPVKMLAGVCVEDTLEFIRQLCLVCKSANSEAKENAAREVLAKGDAQLYMAGVTFRKGLVLIQAIVRAFISRRVGKRKLGGAATGAAIVNASRAAQFQHGFQSSGTPPTMEVGTKFLKELSNGRVYDGVITAVAGKRYTLRYEQDSDAEDDVDEIEMKILLEESVRLHKLRERMHSPLDARRLDDAEISLTSLPDLATVVPLDVGRPRLTKRQSSSREFERLTVAQSRPSMVRSLSNRHSLGESAPTSTEVAAETSTVEGGRRLSSSSRRKLERVLSQASDEDAGAVGATSSPDASAVGGEDRDEPTKQEMPWQASLKQILAKGQAGSEPSELIKKHKPPKSKAGITTSPPDRADVQKTLSNNALSFPELSIPGKRTLPAMPKRRQPTAGFSSPTSSAKPQPKGKSLADEIETIRSKPADGQGSTASHHSGAEASRASSTRVASLPMGGEPAVDMAFGGAYQSTDQKTQEKLALFREIVHRIDGYMKRKRLRVIDLFRFCDADGNGSISPQEMIDTLSQMEIQLSPEQAHEFIDYIDKDGNGSIDIDEFEELVRVARRNEAQREQLKKELQHHKKACADAAKSTAAHRYAALIKNRHRILDELKSLDIGDVGAVSSIQAKSTILRLQIAGVDESTVNELLERARALLSAPDASSASPAAPTLDQPAVDSTVYLQHIAKALNDLEWSKKANRFLDQSWLAQFDSQLERAHRDLELL